ncbi:MAG: right-handed parallel beta-helix repeat-containing protein [Pseudomonadota bacterium]
MRFLYVPCLIALMAIVAGPVQAADYRPNGAKAVPTFESMSLKWLPGNGSAENQVTVRYREAGETEWKDALDLVYGIENDGTYHGSVVHLMAGTLYEFELLQEISGARAFFAEATWPETEDWPIGEVVELPALSDDTLIIDEGGTVEGYKLYQPAGEEAVIDVERSRDFNILVTAPYVIIRGLTLRGAEHSGIRLMDGAHDVLIEGNDISDFGTIVSDDWATIADNGGVSSPYNSTGIARVVVQNNHIHSPYGRTNAWTQARPGVDESPTGWHPAGNNGIFFADPEGNMVIRYNHVDGGSVNYFNDGIGGAINDGTKGAPGANSDIYGNRIENCWDDGIEAEGGGRNVRIWENHIENCMVSIAMRGHNLGPIYVWRNVGGRSVFDPASPRDQDRRGQFIKDGNIDGGHAFVFNNTVFQPEPTPGNSKPDGHGWGLRGDSDDTVSRNNIFHSSDSHPYHSSIDNEGQRIDFDYDFYSGTLYLTAGQEANAIQGVPRYDLGNDPYEYYLTPDSLGVDAGAIIPNFTDGFTGDAPDMGAYEIGVPAPTYGISEAHD